MVQVVSSRLGVGDRERDVCDPFWFCNVSAVAMRLLVVISVVAEQNVRGWSEVGRSASRLFKLPEGPSDLIRASAGSRVCAYEWTFPDKGSRPTVTRDDGNSSILHICIRDLPVVSYTSYASLKGTVRLSVLTSPSASQSQIINPQTPKPSAYYQ